MPIYEFHCQRCGRKTTALVLTRERIGDVRCKLCGSGDLVKLVSRFATVKSEDARLDALADPSSLAGVDENDPKSVARWMKKMGREMGEDVGDDLDAAMEDDMAGGAGEGGDASGSGATISEDRSHSPPSSVLISPNLDRPITISMPHLRRSRRCLCALACWLVAATGYAQPSDESGDQPWWERTTFSGDFRSRYESFYQGEQTPRHRLRLRLRLRLDTELNDDTHFQLRVASGDPGTPVSTNQTFKDFYLPKPFALDRAFVTYNPGAASALTLGAGKFAFPVARTQMVWDDDLNWEGGYQQVEWQAGSNVTIRLVAVETAITEVSADADTFMAAGYGQLSLQLGAHAFEFSVADYGFGRVDQVAIGNATGPLKSINTNRVERDATGNVTGFASDFNLVDVIGQVTLATTRPDYPLRLLVDWVTNTRAVGDAETGIWVEAEYGRAARPTTYAVGYTLARIEQDAVLSPFVFSDMPGSNLWLHMVEASYMPQPRLNLDLALHFSKRLVVTPGASNTWLLSPHLAVRIGF